MGVFCHSDEEYGYLTNIRKEITKPSENPEQKYFELIEPIIIPAKEDVPETTYKYLYIRRPDPTPYGKYLGDVDFSMDSEEFQTAKKSLIDGVEISGARIYDRPDLDMIQLYSPEINSVAYISTNSMTEKVRVKQSDLTKL